MPLRELRLPLLAYCAFASSGGTSLLAQDYRTGAFLATNQVPFADFAQSDLNGNGRPDAILTEPFGLAPGVYIMLDPDMTSPSATVTTVFDLFTYSLFGGALEFMGLADLNADGLDDIVLEFDGIFLNSEVLYLPGDGAGNFAAPVAAATVQASATIAKMGDFNGDGQMDLAAAESRSSATLVFLQNNGSFGPGQPVGPSSSEVLVGDFDGDGFDDLGVAGNGTLTVVPGGATFGTPLTFTIESSLNDGFVEDLDGDGLDDIILERASSQDSFVFALFGDPTTMLGAPIDVIPGGLPVRSDFIGPFDVDGDGRNELLMVSPNTSGYYLIRHDGARGFSPQPYLTDMQGGLIDLDGDGDMDQLVGDFTNFSGYQRLENLAIYGQPCAGSVGDPRLEIGSAIPGNLGFSIDVVNAAPTSLVQLFVSTRATPGPCGAQVDFGRLLYPFMGDPYFFDVTDAAGRAAYSIPIPPGVPEGPYAMQAVVFDPAGPVSVVGFSLSATGGRMLRIY